jgi:hypothetical protein
MKGEAGLLYFTIMRSAWRAQKRQRAAAFVLPLTADGV